MSQSMAEGLYQLFVGAFIPLVVSSLKQINWPNYQKFGLVFVLSLIAASIVPLAQLRESGDFDFSKLAAMMGVIFTTTQLVYQGAFKLYDAETIVNPKAALLSVVKEQLSLYLDRLTTDQIKSILDPESPDTLDIVINQTQFEESEE
jgi:hypothetical protein